MEFKDILKKWAESTKDDIGNKIIDTSTVDTGSLLKSVNYRIVGKKVIFTMLRYGKYTDEGKPKGRNWIVDPRKEPAPRNFFNKIIENNLNELENEIDMIVDQEIDSIFATSRGFNSSSRSNQRTGRTARLR